MNQINKTLYLFLQHSWVTLGAILTLTVLMYFFNAAAIIMSDIFDDAKKLKMMSLALGSVTGGFAAIYIGLCVAQLRVTHLYFTLPQYKSNLYLSYFIACFAFSVVQSVLLYLSGWEWYFSLLMPFLYLIVVSQFTLAEKFWLKIILPAAPFIMVEALDIKFNGQMLALFAASAGFSIFILFKGTTKFSQKHIPAALISTDQREMINQSSNKINLIIVPIFDRFKFLYQPGSLTVALIHPTTRLGLPIILYLLCVSFLRLISGSEDKMMPLLPITMMMVTLLILTLLIECQALARQTKTTAHLFSKNHYFEFKDKVLASNQGLLIKLGIAFIIVANCFAYLVGIALDHQLLTVGIIAILFLSTVFLPLFLMLDWFKIRLKLLPPVVLFAGLCFYFIVYITGRPLMSLLDIKVALSIVSLLVFRHGLVQLWRRQPLEKFYLTYG